MHSSNRILKRDIVFFFSSKLTAIIIEISDKRSMQQISRLYAACTIAGVVLLFNLYLEASERVIGVPISGDPNTFCNEPEVVPISKPLSSSSLNVFISL